MKIFKLILGKMITVFNLGLSVYYLLYPETNVLSCVLVLVANRSTLGENPNSPYMKLYTGSFNFHSVCISCFRDS